jgi:hypothetical protein
MLQSRGALAWVRLCLDPGKRRNARAEQRCIPHNRVLLLLAKPPFIVGETTEVDSIDLRCVAET